MKKVLFVCLFMTMVSISSGICFADGGENSIVYDKEYTQWGFRAHSWITGTGSQTVAHTQIIDMKTGEIIKQIEEKCYYECVPYVQILD
jgi:hypothetical protein